MEGESGKKIKLRGNTAERKENVTQSSQRFFIERAVEWRGWKTVTLFIDKWGIECTNPANKKAKNKLFKFNRVVLEEPKRKNIINSKGVFTKNLNLPCKENI